MRKIKLSQNGRKYKGMYVALVDDEDFERINQYHWSVVMAKRGKYAASIINQKHIQLHRFLMNPPERMIVDHINHDGLDNRKSNLRLATHAQNNSNVGKYSNNTSGFKGVCWNKNDKKWQAQIGFKGKLYVVGRFDDPEEAHKAYCEKAKELNGEFAHF